MVTRLNRVSVLCLRQNRISDVTSLSDLVTLEELDLYYNELKTIHGLEKLTNLTCVYLTTCLSCTCDETVVALLVNLLTNVLYDICTGPWIFPSTTYVL